MTVKSADKTEPARTARRSVPPELQDVNEEMLQHIRTAGRKKLVGEEELTLIMKVQLTR